jgi:hypothetical protein
MSYRWNRALTDELRGSHPRYWGNWTLDGRIAPGAVGVVDPGTGSFEFLAALPSANVVDVDLGASAWKIQSSSVQEHSAKVPLDGTLTDPITGSKITVGLETTWSFSESGSISSTFTLARQSGLVDHAHQIKTNRDWLLERAEEIGMATNGRITQGFVVVTEVLLASCGVNVGAHDAKSTFSIVGSAGAVNAMVAQAGANANPTYLHTTSTGQVESHTWPSTPGGVATSPVPIAFEFASFAGDTVLAGWTTNVSAIQIHLDNSHCTYFVKATANYSFGGRRINATTAITAGLVTNLPPIPVEATDLRLDLSFLGIRTDGLHTFSWPTPLAEFPAGQIVIDLRGIWPGDTHATERFTGATG